MLDETLARGATIVGGGVVVAQVQSTPDQDDEAGVVDALAAPTLMSPGDAEP
jgi:hypothetical protein